MNSNQQLTLFSALELNNLTAFGAQGGDLLQMNSSALQSWKAQIHKHQHQMCESQSSEQVTLFALNRVEIDSEIIEPYMAVPVAHLMDCPITLQD